jgi:hypothetical protein
MELLAGLGRSVHQTLLPELQSPYAQAQASSMIAVLMFAMAASERIRDYDLAEVKDLRRTFSTLARRSPNDGSDVAAAIARGVKAASIAPANRREMEAAVSDLASSLALKRLENGPARAVRAYLRRHLARMRELLGNASPSQTSRADGK